MAMLKQTNKQKLKTIQSDTSQPEGENQQKPLHCNSILWSAEFIHIDMYHSECRVHNPFLLLSQVCKS